MPRIICHYENCKYLDDGYCGAIAIEIDPFDGCMTFEESRDAISDGILDEGDEDDWEDEGYIETDNETLWDDENDDI